MNWDRIIEQKNHYFKLDFQGRSVEAEFADGMFHAIGPLTESCSVHNDEEPPIYSLEADTFFLEAGTVTVTYVRSEPRFSEEAIQELKRYVSAEDLRRAFKGNDLE